MGATFGKFTLDERLGSGGGGEVWKARDTELGRWVALKLLKGDDIERFLREARTVAGLQHPGIVPIYEIGEVDGRHYISTELVAGGTLSRRSFTVREAAAVIRDAARIVQSANDQGIIHRDLKPDNLMIDGAGRVRVMDFGLARSVQGGGTLTASGMMVGTPAYMSPEQARGEIRTIDARTDVYGLGATLYHLLTGRAPFQGGDLLSIVTRVVQEEPVAPRTLRRTVDVELETIALKCLEKDPARRYASARELVEDLDRWLAGEPVSAKLSGSYRLMRRLSRVRGMLAAGGAFVLMLGATLAVMQWRTRAAASALADARQALLRKMRTTSETCLQAALELRRVANLPAMAAQTTQVEAVCARVEVVQPGLAEPSYLVGRIYRAQMRDDEALERQTVAIARDSSFAPARYERVVLRVRKFRALLDRLLREEFQRRGERSGDARFEKVSMAVIADEREESRAQRREIREDLDALLRQPQAVTPGQLLCARGLAAWTAAEEERSLDLLSRAVAAEPGLEEAYEFAAAVHDFNNAPEESARWLDRGVAADPGYVPFFELRASARSKWASVEEGRGRSAPKLRADALADADRAVELAPGRAQAWLARGGVRGAEAKLWLDKDLARAEALYRAAIEDYSASLRLGSVVYEASLGRGGARQNLAGCLTLRRQPVLALREEALADFDAAIKASPAESQAWSWRAIARCGIAQEQLDAGFDPREGFRAALRDFAEAVRLRPSDHYTWLSRADANVTLAQWEEAHAGSAAELWAEAVRDCDRAIRIWPDGEECWQHRGWVRLCLVTRAAGDPSSDVTAGLQDFDEALKRNPRSLRSCFDRGRLQAAYAMWLQGRGRLEAREWFAAAVRDFDRGLEIDPSAPSGLEMRARARRSIGLLAAAREDPTVWLEGAIADCERALLQRDSATGWREKASAGRSLGDWQWQHGRDPTPAYERAIRDWGEFITRAPGDADARISRGAVRVNLAMLDASRSDRRELFAAAVEDFGAAIERGTKDPQAWQFRANAHVGLSKVASGAAANAERQLAIADFEEVIRRNPATKAQVEPLIARLRAAMKE